MLNDMQGKAFETQPQTLQEKFVNYHLRNPRVYEHLVRLARRAKAAGKTSVGIGHLWEVMRWETWIEGNDSLKLNNSYRSRYARLIMDREIDLAGFFETRKLQAA